MIRLSRLVAIFIVSCALIDSSRAAVPVGQQEPDQQMPLICKLMQS